MAKILIVGSPGEELNPLLLKSLKDSGNEVRYWSPRIEVSHLENGTSLHEAAENLMKSDVSYAEMELKILAIELSQYVDRPQQDILSDILALNKVIGEVDIPACTTDMKLLPTEPAHRQEYKEPDKSNLPPNGYNHTAFSRKKRK